MARCAAGVGHEQPCPGCGRVRWRPVWLRGGGVHQQSKEEARGWMAASAMAVAEAERVCHASFVWQPSPPPPSSAREHWFHLAGHRVVDVALADPVIAAFVQGCPGP